MTTEENLRVMLRGDCEIVHTRVFDAPRHLVFDALTKPDVLRSWYGPQGWTLVDCEIDLRAGGKWRFVTRQPSGREIVQFGVFIEIVAPVRFTRTERWLDWDCGEVVVTTELREHEGRTTLTSTTRYPSTQVRDELIAAGANRGTGEHYDKLAALLKAPHLSQ